MKCALIVGGANGIGLSIASQLAARESCQKIYIVDKVKPSACFINKKFECFEFDLTEADFSFFDRFTDIDTLMITAGFGHLAHFGDLDESYIINSFNVNTIAAIRIIHRFYKRIYSSADFYCGVMGSIAGFMSSPLFSVYGASKAALKVFIESVNVELAKSGTSNRILNVSPGSIKGTAFYNGANDLSLTSALAEEILLKLKNKEDLFIPLYDEVFKNVLERYHSDFRAEGMHSYEYKMNSGRMS